MADKENLPKNATEAQGMLIKAFHEKYGDEILPMVERIMGLQGRALGLKAKSKLRVRVVKLNSKT